MRDHVDELLEKHHCELLDRYLLNSLPPDESDAVRVALSKAGFNPDRLERLRRVWQKPSAGALSGQEWVIRLSGHLELEAMKLQPEVLPTSIQSATSEKQTRDTREQREVSSSQHLSADVNRSVQSRHYFNRYWLSRKAWYRAASAAAAVLVLLTGWRLGSHTALRSLSSTSAKQHVSAYTTGNGQRATITLPDGSTVRLNVGSRLEVPVNYLDGNRTLTLTGEALFTVTHSSGSPFTVKAGRSITRVLGTSFVVRNYPTDTAPTIAVREGKVAVGTLVLTPGYETSVSTSGLAQPRPTTNGVFTFADGILTLPSTPLISAIPQLNRWYDADIRLSDPALATQRVVGVFKPGSLTDLASILELTFDVRVVRHGKVLTLFPKG